MEIRSIQEMSQVSDNIISGYAIVFNRESEILYDKTNNRYFIEVIDPSAVDVELIQRSDIKMLIDHTKSRMLARSRYGEGSLQLEIDEYGLKFTFEVPDTVDGQFIKEMIRRNDYNGCSFAFTDDMVDVEYDRERGLFIRNVRKIKQLYDCSIVADPAYSDTEVSVRSLEEVIERETQETTDEIEERSTDETTEVSENNNDVTPSWKEELDSYRQRLN
jgi:HK97 family phage prohead protease